MRFDNSLSKAALLVLASMALVACGDDDDKADKKPDEGQTIPKLDFLQDKLKVEQPKASKVLSLENPNAKIPEDMDKALLAKAKSLTVLNEGDVIQYGEDSINSKAKEIILKDDTVFKMTTGLGQSIVHGAPTKEVRFIYNTPYLSMNMRYREVGSSYPISGNFAAVNVNGLWTSKEAVEKAKAKGGKFNYEGIAWFHKAPGKPGYAKFDYAIDLAKLEGSGKITGLEGVQDFTIESPEKFSKPMVGQYYPGAKEVELQAVSFAERKKDVRLFNGEHSGGSGKAIIKGMKDGDKEVTYVVGVAGPGMESVAGSVTVPGHGGVPSNFLPFFGMKK